jgi:hypothetical protein
MRLARILWRLSNSIATVQAAVVSEGARLELSLEWSGGLQVTQRFTSALALGQTAEAKRVQLEAQGFRLTDP